MMKARGLSSLKQKSPLLKAFIGATAAMSSSSSPPSLAPEARHQKAVLYGPLDDRIQLVSDHPMPSSASTTKNRVLVRVHAVGLNPVDAKDVLGDKLPHDWTRARTFLRGLLVNKVIGLDFAGVVVDENSEAFKKGDEVYGTMPPLEGSLAEYISAPLDQVCFIPNTLSMVQAAALPLVGITCVQALQPHIMPQKSNVLVIGASGGTGHVALQVAKALGAKHVAAVCSSSSADFCKECGAQEIIDYRQGPASILENLQNSPGCPFDVIMDCVTSADPKDQEPINYPKWIQQYKDTLLTDDYVYRRLGGESFDWVRAGLERTLGISCWKDRHEKLFWIRFPQSVPELRQLQEWAEAGKLKPEVSQVYDFSQQGVRDAFKAILERRVRGKVVVQVLKEKEDSGVTK